MTPELMALAERPQTTAGKLWASWARYECLDAAAAMLLAVLSAIAVLVLALKLIRAMERDGEKDFPLLVVAAAALLIFFCVFIFAANTVILLEPEGRLVSQMVKSAK